MVVLEWVMAGVAQARREGLIVASPGWESTVLQKLCDLRASMMQLPDELSARIPLAYVHLTSLLVDALLTLSGAVLKQACADRGMTTSGTKSDLAMRLTAGGLNTSRVAKGAAAGAHSHLPASAREDGVSSAFDVVEEG